ncbi:MAG TPA: Gfo/Idh/MocA family oxidoreductase, partial [Candidatus Elarobacter sp.]|nr:Gfo/Idh/MocA family oxidoreductase [Candidatus Elarobacter sp.]
AHQRREAVNLARGLAQREAEGRPIRVGLIGAGKFGTMILAQLRLMTGVRLCVLADLDPARARSAAHSAGWDANELTIVETGELALEHEIDVLIEATGHEEAGALHAFRAIERGVHVVMVTVEADVVVGPYLHRLAQRNGVVYTMAYGDQPAIVCELVDWARTCGFDVVAAGKGTKFAPRYRRSTPETAFGYYGFSPEQIATGGFNPKMFNSFLDGTKSAIEMVAVANATGLAVNDDGLSFAPASVYDLPALLRPREDGGILPYAGMVDVVSCITPDERFVENHLRWGVFVTFTSQSDYAQRCFGEYGIATDPSGRYAALWRPYHLIGLEIGVSVASAALRGEPTGAPYAGHRAEVVCATRAPMRAGDVVDGEGGYAAYGICVSSERAREERLVPMGLAHGLRLTRDVPADHRIGVDDVAFDDSSFLWKLRREQDALFTPAAV